MEGGGGLARADPVFADGAEAEGHRQLGGVVAFGAALRLVEVVPAAGGLRPVPVAAAAHVGALGGKHAHEFAAQE